MKFARPTFHYLIAILVIAILLRAPLLGAKSLWLDEAASVRSATPRLERLDPNNPPLYFMLLYVTMETIGGSEADIRLPSLLFSVLAVGLLYLLGREVADRETALLAAALLALSPLDVWYGREARMYAMISFVTLLMALGLAWRHWAGFVLFFLATSVGLYSSYLTAPIWLALSGLWLIYWRRTEGKIYQPVLWLAASGAALIVYRPWWAEFAQWAEGALLTHWMFANVRAALGVQTLSTVHFAGAAVLVAGVLLGVAAAAPRLLARKRWRPVITFLVIVGFLGVVVFVPIPRLYAVKRILATAWALVILFVAWLVFDMQQYRRQVVMLLLIVSFVISVVTSFFVPKDDWRGVARTLQARAPQAEVWVDPHWNRIVYDYYRPQHGALFGDPEALERVAQEQGALWLVAERFHGRLVPSSPSEAWLDENMALLEAIPFYRLELRHYETMP